MCHFFSVGGGAARASAHLGGDPRWKGAYPRQLEWYRLPAQKFSWNDAMKPAELYQEVTTTRGAATPAFVPPRPVCGKPCQALNDQNKQCSKTCTSAQGHGGICSCGGPHT